MHYHFNINTFLKAHISLGLTRRYLKVLLATLGCLMVSVVSQECLIAVLVVTLGCHIGQWLTIGCLMVLAVTLGCHMHIRQIHEYHLGQWLTRECHLVIRQIQEWGVGWL